MMHFVCKRLALTAIACLALGMCRQAIGQQPSRTINLEHLEHIESIVKDGLAEKKMPGCVVSIGNSKQVVYLRAFGLRQLQPKPQPMTVDTVFDLASLTKPIATATSIMILVDRGKVRIRNRASSYIPEFSANGKSRITLRQLLLHESGLTPDNALADYLEGPAKAYENVYNLKLSYGIGERFKYSDVGFIVLADIVKRVTTKDIHQFSQENIFRPLGMKETSYLPAKELHSRCAPTEQRNGKWMQGEVHDPRAYNLKGIAGHAGLFSTASDLAKYAQMMLNRGKTKSTRILSPRAMEIMTAAYPVKPSGTRGLGWDKLSAYSSNRGEMMTDSAFGHGGFTGTAIWIDPELDLFVIFLSNRVHPNGKGSVNSIAGSIATIAAAAVE